MMAVLDHPEVFCDAERAPLRRQRVRELVRGMRIAVLMGGDSGEREVSLRSGAGVAMALSGATDALVEAVDIDYGTLGTSALCQDFDLAYLVLHGGRGEDGSIQGYLECVGMPYTGPRPLGCALAMHKPTASRLLASHGIAVPAFIEFRACHPLKEALARALDQIGLPCVVKPEAEGSSLGVSFCHDEDGLADAMAGLLESHGGGMVCEMIPEPEVTVGVLHGHALPVLELRALKEFYDYEAKYTKGLTEFILPAKLDPGVYLHCQEVAREAAAILYCSELARVDLRIDKAGVPRVLDVNTSPGMTETSDLPAEAAHVGMSYADLTLEVLGTALVRAGLMAPEEWR